MVQITKIKVSQRNDGSTFTSFVLEGGIELVQSQSTGKFYAKGKKALLNTTLSEEAAAAMVGSTLPGSIHRVPCDPYNFVVDKLTGETIVLHHSYIYAPTEENVTVAAAIPAGDSLNEAPYETV